MRPQLPVHAEPLHLAVAPEPDASTRVEIFFACSAISLNGRTDRRGTTAAAAVARCSTSACGMKRRDLRVVVDVVVLVPVVLRPRAAVRDEQRRRVRDPALRDELHDVLEQRYDRAACARAPDSRRSLRHVHLEVEAAFGRRHEACSWAAIDDPLPLTLRSPVIVLLDRVRVVELGVAPQHVARIVEARMFSCAKMPGPVE